MSASRAIAALACAALLAACGQGPVKPPAQGTLVVRLSGADGKPYRYESTLSIAWFPKDGNGSRKEVKLGRGQPETTLEIPFGAKITLTAFADGVWLAPEQIDELTPQKPSHECKIAITHEPIKLLARVIGPEGNPYESGSVIARLGREPLDATRRPFAPEAKRLPEPTTLALDVKGETVFSLPTSVTGLGATFVELGFRDLKGFARLPERLVPGEVALGDIRLARPVTVASGVLTGSDNKPLIGGEIRVRAGTPAREVDVTLLRVDRQERGRFSIEAWTSASTCELVAGHEDYVTSDPRKVQVGEKDVRIVLERGGALVVEAAYPAGKPLDALEIWLEGGGARPAPFARKAERVADGKLRLVWRGVPAGTWSLRARNGGAVVTLLDGIAVEAGSVSKDPRLAGVPLDRLW